MTRQEAIKRFQRMKKILSIPNSDAARTIEAIDMAIEALSTDAVNREFYEDVLKANHGLAKENCELKAQIESASAVHGCDGCRYDTPIPQKRCLRCERYWRDSYERKGGEGE